jgi:uncharacterized protein (TIGR02145 family)
MNLFNRHGWGRALLLMAIVTGSIWVLGCGGGDKPSELVGHWVHYDGATRGVPEDIELFKDGTGVVDGGSITWKVENKRLALLSALNALACDYKVSGYTLFLIYSEERNALFVKKDKLEEYKKKEDERKKKEEEERVKKVEQRKKKAEKNQLEIEKKSSYFTDSRDNQKYRSVKIGGKMWMAQNVNYQPQTGDAWCYENDSSNCDKYGRMYDWNTAKTICPAGWHLPSRKEWTSLVKAAGGKEAGVTLKSGSSWDKDGNGTDDFGFSGLPGGVYSYKDREYQDKGSGAYWWTATDSSGEFAYRRFIGVDADSVFDGVRVIDNRYSVRCLQD